LNVIIIIPTYWTWGSEQADGPVEAVYDHPTPLDGESTLPRLLDSLTALARQEFGVLVLTAVTHPELEHPVASRVEGLISPYRAHYRIAQATEADAALIRQRHPGLSGHVQMCTYAGVRNLQLLLPHALGAEIIIALDDDEVVAPNYLRVAAEFVGREYKGERLLGLAGFYLDADGGVMQPEQPRRGNIFQDKNTLMNDSTRMLQAASDRLVPTPVAFGGNTVFHRDLFTRVGFDPGITRGEDIDYLINAHLMGIKFWLDKELLITHLPPDAPDSSHSAPTWSKLHQDVLRFIYEREKIRLADAGPAQFDPYPGRFLRDDVEQQALTALQAEATPEVTERFGSPDAIIAQAQRHAAEAAPRYFEFAARWPDLMEAVGRDTELRTHLLAHFDRSAQTP